jgi:hypothetical protein
MKGKGMRILVVSDSHGNDGMLFRAHQQAGPVDAIIHTGDGELDAQLLGETLGETVLRVAGNCDHGSQAPHELLVTLAGRRIMITHGDRYLVKNGLDQLVRHGTEQGADVILFGHTHLALTEQRHGIQLLNPGTLWGRAPFLSYGILELNPHLISATIYQLG